MCQKSQADLHGSWVYHSNIVRINIINFKFGSSKSIRMEKNDENADEVFDENKMAYLQSTSAKTMPTRTSSLRHLFQPTLRASLPLDLASIVQIWKQNHRDLRIGFYRQCAVLPMRAFHVVLLHGDDSLHTFQIEAVDKRFDHHRIRGSGE